MPVRFASLLGTVLLLSLVGLVKGRPDADRHVGTTSPHMQQPIYVDVVSVQLGDNIDADGPRSSEVGTFQPLQTVRCLGLHEQFNIASTKDINNMGRSYYRRLFKGTNFVQEEELLLLKCQYYPQTYDADEDAKLYITSTTLLSEESIGIPAFVVSHPDIFLHLSLAFLLLAILASLLYFSMD